MRTFFKGMGREFSANFSRFIAIFAITALGCSFFVGLTSIGPDMLLTATEYYEENRLADYRLLSNYGFTEEDITALKQSGDYSQVYAGYGLDVLLEEEQRPTPVRFHSMNESEHDKTALNVPNILEGRYPTAPNECLADAAAGHEIGDVIVISSETEEETLDFLNYKEFTVVGLAESPYYIYHSRGYTTFGDGQLTAFYLVLESAFNSEFYLEVFLKDAHSGELLFYSDEYETAQQNGEERLETYASEREGIRHEEIFVEAQNEIDEARQELNDAVTELEDARIKAQNEFDDADAEIASAAAELADGQKEYDDGVAEIAEQERLLNDGLAQQASGWAAYDSGIATLNTEYDTLVKAQADYNIGLAQYNTNYALYEQGVAQLQVVENDLNNLQAQFDALNNPYQALVALNLSLETASTNLKSALTVLNAYNNTQIAEYKNALTNSVLPELNNAINALADGVLKTNIEAQRTIINNLIASENDFGVLSANATSAINAVTTALDAEITAQEVQIIAQEPAVSALLAQLQAAQAAYAPQKAALDAQGVQFAQALAVLKTSDAQIKAGFAAIEQGRAELADANALLASANAELVSGSALLEKAKTELQEAKKELDSGYAELADGQKELSDEKAKAQVEFADAEEEIADGEEELKQAQEEIDDLAMPEYFVQTREVQPGFTSYESSVDSLRALAGVFPVFFFFVSTLICLTTMTRLVEEKRSQIGTLKLLGYSKGAIAFEYLFYGGISSFFGAAVGAAIGMSVFPFIIFEAYSTMYNMPSVSLAIHPVYVPLSIAISVLCTAGATLLACLGELQSVPAALVRPKAPTAGKRIMLERIGFVWSKLNFIQKVTSRNIFRYKKRFFMTVVGVAGCTALLITGFGLNDTISRVVPLQFDNINNYDATLILDSASSIEEKSSLNEMLPQLGQAIYLDQYSINAKLGDVSSGSMSLLLMVPEQPDEFANFLNLYDAYTGQVLSLDDDGVIITKKLADVLSANAGDEIVITYDNEQYSAKIAHIAENYFANYIYLTPNAYEDILGQKPLYDNVLLKASEQTNLEDALADVMQNENVLGTINANDFRREFDDLIRGLDAVVLLAIISAGTLGVIVLYNLTNINITERTREIATLKVLGFTPGEFSAYIYRESFVLTLIGSFFGLGLGVLLHRFVMQAAMVDDVLFVPYVAPSSFALSVLFTLVSLGIVDIIMMPILRRINSVESLKSIE